MRDGPIRTAIKAVARGIWRFDLTTTRWIQDRRSPPRFLLQGECNGCGKCCEEPTIQVGRITWYLRSARWAFCAWQRVVNGFELVGADRHARALTFRCTHFDPATRLCDSYDTRPGMCRDYPLALLGQPWPELFAECSH